MRLKKSVTKLTFLFLLLADSILTAKAAPAHGGHDGGGGGLAMSSAQEVKDAIRWAMDEVKNDPSPPSWLFNAVPYGPNYVDKDGKPGATVLSCIAMPVTCRLDEIYGEIDQGRTPPTTAWDYLKLSPLVIKDEGSCPATDKRNAAASVSAFHYGATLCFSVSELRKTPVLALRAQVASLLAHEMAHLMGFGEETAEAVQSAVVLNFPQITKTDGSFLTYRLDAALLDAERAMDTAARARDEEQYARVAFLLGKATGIYGAVLDMLPDGINDRTIPVTHPEHYREVKQTVERYQAKLDQASLADFKVPGFAAELKELAKEAVRTSKVVESFIGRGAWRANDGN